MDMDEATEAAALWGSAQNEVYPTNLRLRMALRALEFFGAAYDKARENYINIIVDGPPGPEFGQFVEVEDDEGHSLKVGTWTGPDENGHYRLRLAVADDV